jgi:hypothetical protein
MRKVTSAASLHCETSLNESRAGIFSCYSTVAPDRLRAVFHESGDTALLHYAERNGMAAAYSMLEMLAQIDAQWRSESTRRPVGDAAEEYRHGRTMSETSTGDAAADRPQSESPRAIKTG